jgi:L-amino acid N-acyltransferase YncA
MIRADVQRCGLGAEALDGLAGLLRDAGKPAVRAGVIARNPAGRALVTRLGFEPVATRTMRMASEEEVLVLERRL